MLPLNLSLSEFTSVYNCRVRFLFCSAALAEKKIEVLHDDAKAFRSLKRQTAWRPWRQKMEIQSWLCFSVHSFQKQMYIKTWLLFFYYLMLKVLSTFNIVLWLYVDKLTVLKVKFFWNKINMSTIFWMWSALFSFMGEYVIHWK